MIEKRTKRVLIIAVLIHAAAFAAVIIICVSLIERMGRDAVSIALSIAALMMGIDYLILCFFVKQLPRVAKVVLTSKAIFLFILALTIFRPLRSEGFVFVGIGILLFGFAYVIGTAITQSRQRSYKK